MARTGVEVKITPEIRKGLIREALQLGRSGKYKWALDDVGFARGKLGARLKQARRASLYETQISPEAEQLQVLFCPLDSRTMYAYLFQDLQQQRHWVLVEVFYGQKSKWRGCTSEVDL